jgi:Cu-Zn family superoxide dismutase
MRTNSIIGIAIASVLGAGLWSVGTVAGAATQHAHANLVDTNGNPAGTVSFTTFGNKTIVDARIRIPREFEGFHGFHVHAKGVCDPKAVDDTGKPTPFFSAGGHYSATVQGHSSHDGDMPSLMVLGDGTARLTFRTDRLDLSELRDADGSAVIMHVGRDDFANIPARYAPNGPDDATQRTGDAGGRLLCGVVR